MRTMDNSHELITDTVSSLYCHRSSGAEDQSALQIITKLVIHDIWNRWQRRTLNMPIPGAEHFGKGFTIHSIQESKYISKETEEADSPTQR